MQTLTEKRVFGSKTGVTEVLLATEAGVAVATVSGAQIGTFGLAHREPVVDLAVSGRRLIVGTEDRVLVGRISDSDDSPPPIPLSAVDAPTDPVAVGFGPQGLLVADSEGTVAHAIDETAAWTPVGETAGVRAIDGGLIAASDGVYRHDDGLTNVGLSDVRDVAGHGVPLAATAEGVFRLANGWVESTDTPAERVASDGHGHSSAVGPDGLSSNAGERWKPDELPVEEPLADVAYGSGIRVAATEAGTLCVTAGDGWRHQRLGLGGVSAVAVAGTAE